MVRFQDSPVEQSSCPEPSAWGAGAMSHLGLEAPMMEGLLELMKLPGAPVPLYTHMPSLSVFSSRGPARLG
jgi:hypothetical protein